MRKEKSAAFRKEIISKLRSPAATKRRETLYSLRTPTVGQRKKHVIQLIDRVLRKMKAPKDVEKKLIKLYESLSEKQIKSLFGGRSPEFVKNTLKKQIDYLKKKKR
jgi:transcription initiation factor TFIIIB Brf1 subunit/transcription initiation factor TFIIB